MIVTFVTMAIDIFNRRSLKIFVGCYTPIIYRRVFCSNFPPPRSSRWLYVQHRCAIDSIQTSDTQYVIINADQFDYCNPDGIWAPWAP